MAAREDSIILKNDFQTLRTFECSWTVKNFSLIQASRPYKSEVLNHVHESFQWEIQRSSQDLRRARVYFKLCCMPSRTGVRAELVTFSGSIRTTDGRVLHRMNSFKWYEVSSVREELLDVLEISAGDLFLQLKNDALVIYLKAFYILPSDSEYMICQHKKMIKDFCDLYKMGKMTDMVIVVQGTVKMKVHSVVLATRSKVFASMFDNSFLEGRTRRIEITDFAADTIKCMLEFFYRASVDKLDVDKALDLLRAADKYDVPDLTTCCCDFLIDNIDTQNVVPVLVSADMFNVASLKNSALDFLIKKKSSVSLGEHKPLLFARPSVLYEMVECLLGF